jgi:hypothetical protein
MNNERNKIMVETPILIEYGVELGYGIIYAILALFSYRKSKQTQNKLAKFFFVAFLFLALSGIYGGIAGLLGEFGYTYLPVIGSKIEEVYEGLTVIALIFFLVGLIKLKSK